MTRNRNRKKRIRDRARQDQVPYNVARRRIEGSSSTPTGLPDVRLQRAGYALSATRAELIPLLTNFAGVAAPTGQRGTDLVTHTLETVASRIPLGVVNTLYDLEDATRDIGNGPLSPRRQLHPPLPRQVIVTCEQISKAIDALSPAELRDAAKELQVSTATARQATRITSIRERNQINAQADEMFSTVEVDEEDDPGLVWIGDGDDDRHDRHNADSRANDIMAILTTQDLSVWTQVHIASLRTTVLLHLARIGDAFLRVSEKNIPPLSWDTQRDELHAIHTLPGGSTQLIAKVSVEPSEATHAFLFATTDAPPPPSIVAHCAVGVVDESGTFDRFTGSKEVSVAAAMFSAAALIAEISDHPNDVRSASSHRLLISHHEANEDKTATLDLYNVLKAVGSEHQYDPDEQSLWYAHPHVSPDDDLISIVAIALDSWECPLPQQTEAANSQPLGANPFEQFLTAHNVRFTPAARMYLVAQQATGDDGQPLSKRHRAGMQAVLNALTPHELIRELRDDDIPTDDATLLVTIHQLSTLLEVRHLTAVINTYFE